MQKPKLIIFDEPTRGVDMGTITEIHQFINRLADEGIAVVVISSYLPKSSTCRIGFWSIARAAWWKSFRLRKRLKKNVLCSLPFTERSLAIMEGS